eukprot:8060633-Alexandrium_andersonii.AAC.1
MSGLMVARTSSIFAAASAATAAWLCGAWNPCAKTPSTEPCCEAWGRAVTTALLKWPASSRMPL